MKERISNWIGTILLIGGTIYFSVKCVPDAVERKAKLEVFRKQCLAKCYPHQMLCRWGNCPESRFECYCDLTTGQPKSQPSP